jgi:hypothetical protein
MKGATDIESWIIFMIENSTKFLIFILEGEIRQVISLHLGWWH